MNRPRRPKRSDSTKSSDNPPREKETLRDLVGRLVPSRRVVDDPSRQNLSPRDGQAAVDSTADTVTPSRNVRRLLSIWLPLHFFALLVSFSAVVEPSAIQNRVLNFIRPYLQVTHFGADDRPLYLVHGDVSEQPHRLQQSRVAINSIESAESEVRWTTIEPDGRPGLAGTDRYARWLSTAASLAENEEPGLVAELLLPIVQADESIRAIRIRRLANELNEESFPYSARVIRDSSGVSLVQLQWTRLSAVAGVAEDETEGESDD